MPCTTAVGTSWPASISKLLSHSASKVAIASARRELLRILGNLDMAAGNEVRARSRFAMAMDIARALAERGLESDVLSDLGNLAEDLGFIEEAQLHYESALVPARAIGDRQRESAALGNLAVLYGHQGRMQESLSQHEAALKAARHEVGQSSSAGQHVVQHGPAAATAWGRATGAVVPGTVAGHCTSHGQCLPGVRRAVQSGHRRAGGDDLASARAAFEQAIVTVQQLADRRPKGSSWATSGCSSGQRARPIAPPMCWISAPKTLLEAVSDHLSLALVLCYRAELQLRQVEAASARKTLQRAEAMAREVGAGEMSELAAALAQLRGQVLAQALISRRRDW